MPLKTATCREESCKAPMVWLVSNRDPAKNVPVDADSLSDDDVELLERREPVTFDPARHVSHFKTCKTPQRFTGRSR